MTDHHAIDLTSSGFAYHDVVVRVANSARLLVATDFDGVLAPIVSDPQHSAPLPDAIKILGELVSLPNTTVAVVSGREVAQLRRMIPDADRFILVGSHGAEFATSDGTEMVEIVNPERQRLLGTVRDELEGLAGQLLGLFVEHKSQSVAVHFRRLAPQQRDAADAAVQTLFRQSPGRVVRWKEVGEFAVGSADKGSAVAALSNRVGATARVYLGDDVTDEDVFRILGSEDLTVKVGPGSTAARYRVPSPTEVVEVLAAVLTHRRTTA